MATTTVNYGLKKPATADFYNVADSNGNMDIIDTQLKAEADAIAGKAPSVHSHVASALPSASTSAAGISQLSSSLTGTSETKAATEYVAKLLNDKATALERTRDFLPASQVGDNCTITDATVTAYYNGLRRTVYFTGASNAPQLRINTLAYAPVSISPGKPLKVAQYQVVDVVWVDNYFFAARSGGGIELPSTIAAGGTPVLCDTNAIAQIANAFYYTAIRSKTCKKAGVYRVYYNASMPQANTNSYAKLQKNGVDVASSEVVGFWSVTKTIDVSLAVNDVLTLLVKGDSSVGSVNQFFSMTILAADLATALNTLIL